MNPIIVEDSSDFKMDFDIDIIEEVEVSTDLVTETIAETEPFGQEMCIIRDPNYPLDYSDREYVSFEEDLHSRMKAKDIVEEAMEDLFADSDLEEDPLLLPDEILAEDSAVVKLQVKHITIKTRPEKCAHNPSVKKLRPGRRKVDDCEKSTIERQIKESEEFRATLERRPIKGDEPKDTRTSVEVKNVKVKQKKIHSCLTCQEVFLSHRALNRHLKTHSVDGASFQCPECSRTFNQPCNLRRHMRRHSGERPFKCPVCDKQFSDQGYLSTHIRCHTDVRPFVCSVCSKEFIDRSNLMKHSKTHSGERPHACTVCARSFVQLSDLKRHTLVHTGERPFACDLCDKRYQQIGDLVQHKRQHSGERPHVCSKCGRAFANKRYLLGHERLFVCDRAKAAALQGQESRLLVIAKAEGTDCTE